jgi:hypothetical protein
MRGRLVKAKYTTTATTAWATMENANDDGRPAEIDGSAKRLMGAKERVINLGLLVNVYLKSSMAVHTQYKRAQTYLCNSATICHVVEQEGRLRNVNWPIQGGSEVYGRAHSASETHVTGSKCAHSLASQLPIRMKNNLSQLGTIGQVFS